MCLLQNEGQRNDVQVFFQFFSRLRKTTEVKSIIPYNLNISSAFIPTGQFFFFPSPFYFPSLCFPVLEHSTEQTGITCRIIKYSTAAAAWNKSKRHRVHLNLPFLSIADHCCDPALTRACLSFHCGGFPLRCAAPRRPWDPVSAG